MSTTSPITDLISPKEKDSNKLDKLTYISTYSMGKIGIKKIIEDPFKTPIVSATNNINITNNTNNNTNNTNTNTNSNTNNNSSKNKEIQTSEKKLKNMHIVSPNIVHTRAKSGSSNSIYHKSTTNQRMNIIKKNNSKSSMIQLGLPKIEFSKTANNFYIYTNNNIIINNINKIYSKDKTKYLNGKSYSKKKKINSNNKLIKERKLTDGAIKSQPHSYHSSCIFSSMSPSSIKREKKKYSASNIIPSETNVINYDNSLKRDISKINLKNSNLSSTDINPNTLKLILPEEENNKDKTNIHFEQKYQMTETNVNYLRVRRRPDFQNHFNNTPKIESTPNLLNRDKIKIDNKNEILNENKNFNLTTNNRNRNNIFLNEHETNKECLSNSNDINNESNNIPKLNLNNDIKNIKNNKDIIKNSYDNGCFKINISTNKKKEGEKERENNFAICSKKNNNNSSNKNLYYINNKNYTNSKNKKNKIKNIEINKSNSNNNNFIKLNSKIKKYNNIENIKYININYKKTRNSKQYSSSSSKNKSKKRTRKNYSLSNGKNYVSKNRDKSTGDTNYKNKIISIDNKMKNNKIIKDKNIDIIKDKNVIDFDCPEELHYFMVNMTINYKYLNENF